MKKMSKIFAWLLAMALCLSLSAASFASGEPTEETGSVPETVEPTEEADAPVDDAADAPAAGPEEPEPAGPEEPAPAEDGAAGIAVDAAHFPDATFRNYVASTFDADGDGSLSDAERAAVTSIWQAWDSSLTDLTGIEYFPALETLRCYGGRSLTSLDVSHNPALKLLSCESSGISSLDLTGCTALETLYCSGNPRLLSIDLSDCVSLRKLTCSANMTFDLTHCPKLTALNIMNANFGGMGPGAAYTGITALDLSGNPALEWLRCSAQLTSLDLSHNPALKELYIGTAALASLDLTDCPALEAVNCAGDNGALTSLKIAGLTSLRTLDCSGNQLASLDLTGCTALEVLYCSGNRLTSLDLSGCPGLRSVGCGQNALTTLDISACPLLIYGVEYAKAHPSTGDHHSGDSGVSASVSCDDTVTLVYPAPIASGGVAIDAAHFPDAAFRGYISNELDKDKDGTLSDMEIALTKEIYVAGMGVSDLTGIGYFTALEDLGCSDNALTVLDLTGLSKLNGLSCQGNALTALDVTPSPRLAAMLSDPAHGYYEEDYTGVPFVSYVYEERGSWESEMGDGPVTSLSVDKGVRLTPTPGAASAAIPGDMDGDGEITIADAAAILRCIGGAYNKTADLDGDGSVTVYDAVLAVQLAVGL